MSIDDNRALVRRFYEAVQREAWDQVAQLCHDDFVAYSQVDMPVVGSRAFIEKEKKSFDSVPGFTLRIVELIAEGDKVAAYLIIEGVQTRPLMGLPPSGRTLRFSLLNLLTVAQGRVIEKRAHYDVHDILHQLTTQG